MGPVIHSPSIFGCTLPCRKISWVCDGWRNR